MATPGGELGDGESSSTGNGGNGTLSGGTQTEDPSGTGSTSQDWTSVTSSSDTTSDGDESDTHTTGSGETGDSLCGNGVLDEGEGCDEPNGQDADGCNEDCTVSGALIWSRTEGGASGLTEEFFGVAVDDEGNAYATGAFSSTNLGADFWVQQFASSGDLGWGLKVDGTAGVADGGRGALVHGGSVYFAGLLNTTDAANNWRVDQYSLAGAAGWSAMYGGVAMGTDVARGVAADAAGRLFAAGRHSTEMGGEDIHVRQYLDGGAVGWTASYDGLAHGKDAARAVAVDPGGNVIVVGFETVAGQGLDGWVRKYSPAGVPLWTRSHQGAAALDEAASGVATDPAGNIVVAGYQTLAVGRSAGWVRKWDADGADLWTQTWTGPDATGFGASFLATAIDGAGHIVVVGHQSDAGLRDGVVQKLDANGDIVWTESYSSDIDGEQRFAAVAIGPGDHIWAAGRSDLSDAEDGRQAWLVRIAP